eukprot:gene7832-16017_t
MSNEPDDQDEEPDKGNNYELSDQDDGPQHYGSDHDGAASTRGVSNQGRTKRKLEQFPEEKESQKGSGKRPAAGPLGRTEMLYHQERGRTIPSTTDVRWRSTEVPEVAIESEEDAKTDEAKDGHRTVNNPASTTWAQLLSPQKKETRVQTMGPVTQAEALDGRRDSARGTGSGQPELTDVNLEIDSNDHNTTNNDSTMNTHDMLIFQETPNSIFNLSVNPYFQLRCIFGLFFSRANLLVTGWRTKSSPRTNILMRSVLSMDHNPNGEKVHPLKSFILKHKQDILNEGMWYAHHYFAEVLNTINYHNIILLKMTGIKNDEHLSFHSQGGHKIEGQMKFIPYENVANEIVKFMEKRRKRRNDGQGGDKSNNPLLALIGSPGMGKSTFLTHFPESEAYKRYLDGRRSPIVSTVSFSNDTPTSVGVGAIGLRIIYGAAVSMGLLDVQSYPWEQFHNTFISSWPSSTREVHDAIDLLRELFGANRPILILVDDISKIADPSLDELYPSTFYKRVDGVIVSKLLYALCASGDLDVICSSISPGYMSNLAGCIQRQADYVLIPSITTDNEIGKYECEEWADTLIDEMGVNDTIPDEIKYLLRNVYLLYSGHPRSIEGMVTAFNDPVNKQKWTDLGKLCVTESIVKVLFQLVADLPLHPNCDISNWNQMDLDNIVFNYPSQWSTEKEKIIKLVESGQLFITYARQGYDVEVAVQTLALLRLLSDPDKYLSQSSSSSSSSRTSVSVSLLPRIESAFNFFHNLMDAITLDVLFERIVEFTIITQSYARTQSYAPGYDSLVIGKDDHFYLQMKLKLSDEDLPSVVGNMIWHCILDYYHRNTSDSDLSSLHMIVYKWEIGVDKAHLRDPMLRDLVKEAAHHIGSSSDNGNDHNKQQVLRAVDDFIDNYFRQIHIVDGVDIEKSLNPSFLPLVRLIAATTE